jgi:hypothetical protein
MSEEERMKTRKEGGRSHIEREERKEQREGVEHLLN